MQSKSKILIVDNHSRHISKLQDLFCDCEVSVIDCDNFHQDKAVGFDLVVLSGGSHVLSAEKSKKAYEEEINFILNTHMPVIGICLGCQLIAKAFGGRLEKSLGKRRGIFEVITKGKSYKIFESHKYIIKELPKELVLLAESDDIPQIIKHKTKPIYGFQFHPEVFTRKTDGKKLFNRTLRGAIVV